MLSTRLGDRIVMAHYAREGVSYAVLARQPNVIVKLVGERERGGDRVRVCHLQRA
jgi:hypothetical protein